MSGPVNLSMIRCCVNGCGAEVGAPDGELASALESHLRAFHTMNEIVPALTAGAARWWAVESRKADAGEPMCACGVYRAAIEGKCANCAFLSAKIAAAPDPLPPIDLAMPDPDPSRRPSAIFRPALKFDGEVGGTASWWTATYGDLRVTGDTPEAAMDAFDRAWKAGTP